MSGFKFRLYDTDADDLGTRAFSEPNWSEGDVVALGDRILRVKSVVYLRDDDRIRGMLMLEAPSRPRRLPLPGAYNFFRLSTLM